VVLPGIAANVIGSAAPPAWRRRSSGCPGVAGLAPWLAAGRARSRSGCSPGRLATSAADTRLLRRRVDGERSPAPPDTVRAIRTASPHEAFQAASELVPHFDRLEIALTTKSRGDRSR
jgi:hypothetical protein